MKEIWKIFADKCKLAWKQTADALAKLFNNFVEDLKALLVKGLDLIQDIIGNSMKAIETITINLVVAALAAFFCASYDSLMYGFEKLKGLLFHSSNK